MAATFLGQILRSQWVTYWGYGWGAALVTLGLLAQPSVAIPGQSATVAESWIRNNPTLNPAPNERLSINRTPSPGQRFSFQASLFPVAGALPTDARRTIRTERFTLVDHANAITVDRLEESLRLIYGPQIFNDYRQGEILFEYPTNQAGPNPNLTLVGTVRSGERFAYWYELAYGESGTPYLGRMVVFLKEDLPLLQTQLVPTR
ncbi:MAG: hypothetical protein ACHWZW_23200 [Spirulina sp.]